MVTLIEDTRQQAKKHELKRAYFANHGINVIRSKLPVGDYALLTDLSTIIDTKKDLQEVIGNVTTGHKAFVSECEIAKQAGIRLIILIEQDDITCMNDVYQWYNPRLRFSSKATTGRTLGKIMHGMQVRHGVEWMFCKRAETGKRILELLGVNTDENNGTWN